jgi:hypothetical protein
LVVFSTCGIEAARTRFPLADWALFQNPHNRQGALELLEELQQEKDFLSRGETVEQYFFSYNYGGSAMTLRGQASKSGFWKDGQVMEGGVVGVHQNIRDHFTKTGFIFGSHT